MEATKFVDSKGAPATLHFVNPGQISIWTKVNDRLIALYLDTGDTRCTTCSWGCYDYVTRRALVGWGTGEGGMCCR